MAIDTSKVLQRRTLDFHSMDEVLREAERLAAARHIRALGNWNLGQILKHLATTIHVSIDGPPIYAPFFARIFGRLFKNRILSKPFPGGIKLPAKAEQQLVSSPDVSVQDALIGLRAAIQRFQTETKRAENGFFGRLTNAEWDLLHRRHAALHFSFLEPTE